LGVLAWVLFLCAVSMIWVTANASTFYSRYVRWCRACNIPPPSRNVAFWLNFVASAIMLIAALLCAAMYLASS
jgi:hypothetical protein